MFSTIIHFKDPLDSSADLKSRIWSAASVWRTIFIIM